MGQKRLRVYLADLRHNYQGVMSTDAMPLGVAYMKAVMDAELPEAEASVYAYPENLLKVMKEEAPDVLMLSNYMWNEALSLHFARIARLLNPSVLVVMGGPNIPIEDERKIAFVRQRPEIDIYATGEGDFYAAELVRRYIGHGLSKEKLFQEHIHSSVYRKNGNEFVCTPIEPRTRFLDDIPSPWLTGVLDKFFDGKMAPLFETNRGCPFTCTFCVQGTRWYTKVSYFSLERIKEEVFYMGRMIKERCPEQKVLRIADPNYGMYKRDVEISAYLGETQKLYQYPLFIDATTGKNQAENIIKSIEKANGAIVMYQAVQSLDEDVLMNVNRKNIKLETYEQVQVHVRGRGLRSSSDLILGLPGESLESHVTSLKKLINSGTHKLNNFQAMMLKGSEMETLKSREKYAFNTRYRLLPKNFGEYNGEKVFDIEEIIVSTDTLSFDDYLKARTYHLVISVFWNESRFEQIVDLLEKSGFEKWDFVESVVRYLSHADTRLKEMLDNFLKETREELFSSGEEATAFYAQPDNFDKARKSLIGDNLMYKYRAIASFLEWETICNTVFNAIEEFLVDNNALLTGNPLFKEFWNQFKEYCIYTHSFGQTAAELIDDKRAMFRYDIFNWLKDGMPLSLENYELSAPKTYVFYLPAKKKKNIAGAIKIWSYDLKALPMLVKRIHNDWQRREYKVQRPVRSHKVSVTNL